MLYRLIMALAACLLTVALTAQAAEHGPAKTGGVNIELNRLKTVGKACRAYLVITNKTHDNFKSLKLDTVMFDSDGVVAKRLAVETAPLPAGKTSLKVFDIDNLTCKNIGRILLNGVLSCKVGDSARGDCLDMLSASSRGKTPFIK